MTNLSEIFEINKNLKVEVEYYKHTKIFYVDNFYKRPKEVVYWFFRQPLSLWKSEETPSYNGQYFFDYRHRIIIDELEPVYKFIENLWGDAVYDENLFSTNVTKFSKDYFNDYKNHYWWPHKDKGQTSIIYLNEEETDGTNLYEQIIKDDKKINEHGDPWRSKKYWKSDKTIKSVFNRMVSFEADKLFHGASIIDDKFFNEYRINQVLFFDRIEV